MIKFKTKIKSRNRIQIPSNELLLSDLREGDIVIVTVERVDTNG
ncbi:MAG: hypothetical protein ACTSO3_13860 [Candidatus Heimdallarchaeaceae archaeon]